MVRPWSSPYSPPTTAPLSRPRFSGTASRKDRVIQYPIHLVQREGSTVTERNSPWLDHLLLQKPVSPGLWKWQYQYHAGGLTHYEIRYNSSHEMFEGEIVIDPERDSGRAKK